MISPAVENQWVKGSIARAWCDELLIGVERIQWTPELSEHVLVTNSFTLIITPPPVVKAPLRDILFRTI